MDEKNIALAILVVIVVLALVGLVLHYKTARTAEFIVSPYQGGVIQEPVAAQRYNCEIQGRLGNVPKDFIMGVSEAGMQERGARYCVKAPAEIAPIEYCCQPLQP